MHKILKKQIMTIEITKAKIHEICEFIDDKQVDDIESFVVFLGHAHSGHSIIGALLDSHPDASIANEINVPKIILDHSINYKNLKKIALYYSMDKSDDKGWINTGYKYFVPDGFQGKTKFPKVLGDKKGGGSTRIIRNNPIVLDKLIDLVGEKIKFINVIRDPLDNIAAFSHYWKETLGQKHVDRYYENLETNQGIEKEYPNNFHKIYHHDLIKNPFKTYTLLLEFLNLEINNKQIHNCIDIVRSKENKRSNTIKWSKRSLEEIKNKNILFNLTDIFDGNV
ncbi:hypothetical protein MNBD_GAMMA03-14 [hydrothermal vent metagenome]|uniref:Sulfotransferase domain-containing protein n=1 Tax=hydrothermal vent metagenome TaxID=652676 RepID=A0A3B0W1T9_9ZZZZ